MQNVFSCRIKLNCFGPEDILTSRHPWKDLLQRAEVSDHIAQLYQDQDFLTEAVSLYIAAGLSKNEAVLVVALKDHWEAFVDRLEKDRFSPGDALQRGQLRYVDAEQASSKFMFNRKLDKDRFLELFGDVVNQFDNGYEGFRVYGEMVDMLWLGGNMNAAVELEELWNELQTKHKFSIFCSYQMNNLAMEIYSGPLQSVCQTHSHLIPTKNYARFHNAVEQVLMNVLGPTLSENIRSIVAKERSATNMPEGQSIILLLQESMPHTADKVLSLLRSQLP